MKGDTPEAEELAEKLSKTAGWIEFALKDMAPLGGKSCVWSTSILIRSPLTNAVDSELTTILGDTKQALERRITAAHVLWLRNGDREALRVLFKLVSERGPDEIAIGRKFIAEAFESPEVAKRFLVPATEALGMTIEQFEALLPRANRLNDPLNKNQ
jgi:hypothetical protein